MLYSKVFLRLHWGFSVSVPFASKAKPSFYLPPPTTLVGALAYGKFRGVDNRAEKGKMVSPAFGLKVRAAASYERDFLGGYIEDIVKNVIMYFQRKERRLEERYRYGIVPTGKVYSPNGVIKVVYVADMDRGELEKLSWSITRLGCKECLVSVEDVEIGDAKKVKGRVKTSYYFPADVKVISGRVEYVDFWDENGYIWGSSGNTLRYAIPVVGYPLTYNEVEVEANEAYEVGGEHVVFG
jgi:CRISPR-associated protein Cas5a/b/c